MTYVFIPPEIEEGPAGGNRLFARFRIGRSISVAKFDGEYYEIRFPDQDTTFDADIFYLGGHEYEVSESEKNDLEAAGYTVITR